MKLNLCGFVAVIYCAATISGQSSCSSWGTSETRLSGSVSKYGKYVGQDQYLYYYYQGQAYQQFTVTVTRTTGDPDLCISKAANYPTPSITVGTCNAGTSTAAGSDSLVITPSATECYTIGVRGYSASTFDLLITTNASTTYAPTTPAPTYGYYYTPQTCSGVYPWLNQPANDVFSPVTVQSQPGSYVYLYFNKPPYQSVYLTIYRDYTSESFEVYIADAFSNRNPNSGNYQQYQTGYGSISTSIAGVDYYNGNCIAIGILSQVQSTFTVRMTGDYSTSGPYYTSAPQGSSDLGRILGLSIGLPLALLVILFVASLIRRRRQRALAGGAAVPLRAQQVAPKEPEYEGERPGSLVRDNTDTIPPAAL